MIFSRASSVLVVLGLSLSAAPGAFAVDYYTGTKDIVGSVFSVTGHCTEVDLSLGARIENADGSVYYNVRPPQDADGAGWTRVREVCGTTLPVKIQVKVEDDNYADFKLVYLAPAVQGEPLLEVEGLISALNEKVAPIDSITGLADLTNDDLSFSRVIRDADDPSANLVFFREMQPRRTIDFLSQCFQTCENVTFKLMPLEFGPYGLSLTLLATDWSLPEEEAAIEDVPTTKTKQKTNG